MKKKSGYKSKTISIYPSELFEVYKDFLEKNPDLTSFSELVRRGIIKIMEEREYPWKEKLKEKMES